jgi:hypothetical protein
VDDGLEKAARLGEEGLCSLLRSSVNANTANDVDLGQVAAVSEQGHARHGGGLHVASDGDGNHGLAGFIADHAEEVQRSGGGIRTQSQSRDCSRWPVLLMTWAAALLMFFLGWPRTRMGLNGLATG